MTVRPFLLITGIWAYLLIAPPLAAMSAGVAMPDLWHTADDEYERYKREGDDLFKKGEYEKARKKFLACLEVPNFSNDTYAKGKVEQCMQANKARLAGEVALKSGKAPEGIEFLKKVLVINPDDPITRKMLADYWEKEGNAKEAINDPGAAKTRYEEALKYTTEKARIQSNIQRCQDKLQPKPKKDSVTIVPPKQVITPLTPAETKPTENKPATETPKPAAKTQPTTEPKKDPQTTQTEPKRPSTQPTTVIQTAPTTPIDVVRPQKTGSGTKLLVGAIGLAAGGYAFVLNSQWQTKLSALNAAAQIADPNNDGLVLTQTEYANWQTANDAAKAAQSKHGLFVACMGIAAGAALYETYLLIRKPKPSRSVSVTPASQGMGVAVRLDF